MNPTEQTPPFAAADKQSQEQALPTSGEGSASIVARLQIQRELAGNPLRGNAKGPGILQTTGIVDTTVGRAP